MQNIMTNSDFIGPILALIGLTAIVWAYMYYVRISYMVQNKVNPEIFKTAEGKSKMDGPQNYPAENYNHLFEMPVLFYVVSLLFVVTGKGDDISLYLAWGYVGLRAVHSYIQCTGNHIMTRFRVFMLSSLVLFGLAIKAAILML